jgi:hypothetical protein
MASSKDEHQSRAAMDCTDGEAPSFTPTQDAFCPAYDTRGGSGGPQCSAHGDFCFFCEYAESPAEGDAVGQLKALARELAAAKKELPIIVSAVFRAYEGGVRQSIEWTDNAGKVVVAPEWSLDAIRRHLTFSNEFSGLFHNTVDHIFQSLISRLNDTVVDRETGLVHDEHRKALVDTIRQYSAWERHTKGVSLTSKRKK